MIKCPECGTLVLTGSSATVSKTNKTNKTNKEESDIMRNNNEVSSKGIINASDVVAKGTIPVTQYISVQDLAKALAPFLPAQSTGSLAVDDPINTGFAPNSKFHGKIMADGYVFNPYLHRRFLPAQYLKMINHKSGLEGFLRENYAFKYSIDYTRKEVRKLAFLQKNDSSAFAERSQFFTLDVVKKIMSDYVVKVKSAIACARKYDEKNVIFNKRKYKIDSPELQNMLNRLNVFAEQVNGAYSYSKMQNILDGFNYIKMHDKTKKSQDFIHAYKKAGAYYTLKHLFMFEDLEWTISPSTSLGTLRKLLDAGYEGYQFHAMLKQLIRAK